MFAMGCTIKYLDSHAQPQKQLQFTLKLSKMGLNDRFTVSTAPMQVQYRSIFDRLYRRQMFALGATG
jgi:hypothetical protein